MSSIVRETTVPGRTSASKRNADVLIFLAKRTALSVLLTLALSLTALGQQITGDILGDVTDTTGAVIPTATVVVRNLDTQAERTEKISSKGEYVVNSLPPGPYSVTVSSAGFKTFTVQRLVLAAGDRARVNAALQVGQTSETVAVEALAPALQSDSSVLQTIIDNRSTQNLPLNGRDYIQQIQLTPGANDALVSTGGLLSGSQFNDKRQTSAVSVNGQSELVNDEMVDGTDNNERDIGTIGVRPSIDSIQEMQVQTNTYTAEAGRTVGGVIDVITKSGTNAFHGDVFEFFRNDVLDAYPFAFGVQLPKTELRQNQFGASLGGPIKKDKLFFFGAYEGLRLVNELAPTKNVVPTLFEEQNIGNFSDVGGATLTPAQLDTAGVDYFKLYPAPNSTGSTGVRNIFVASNTERQTSDVYDAKFDAQLNPKDRAFARYIYNNVETTQHGALPQATVAGVTVYPGFGTANSPQKAHNAQLNYIHIFSPTLLAEGKVAYTRIDNEYYGGTVGTNANQAFGQPNINTPIGNMTGLAPVLVIGATNLGGAGLYNPVLDQDNVFQYQGSLTYTRGAHNFKFGSSLIRRQLEPSQSNFGEGFWIFSGLSGLLQGNYLSVTRQLDLVTPRFRTWEPSMYAEDDWHFNHRLTFNLGVRYDHFSPFTEPQNHISDFNPVTATIMLAGQNGVSNTAGIQSDYTGLAPRLGFAFSATPTLVIRGGYGISFVPENGTSSADLKNQPFTSNFGACGYFNCGIGKFAAGLPAIAAGAASPLVGAVAEGFDPHFRISYVHQYNLTVQKDLKGNVATVSYVGLAGRHLVQTFPDLNAPSPNTCGSNAACYNPLRPFYHLNPNLTQVTWMQSEAGSSYNAVQASLERRLLHGLSINANYTWAHALDDSSGFDGSSALGAVPSRIGQLDYGNSALDIRQRLAETIAWELPFGSTLKGVAALAGKGWHINVINAWSTGQAFTVTNSSNVANTDPGSSNTDRPNQVARWQVASPTITQFFNPTAFQAQPAGTLGDERANQLFGPHVRRFDASVFKVFPLEKGMNIEFRAELFNVANQANFSTPNSSLGGALFGQISATALTYAPREAQFALKVYF